MIFFTPLYNLSPPQYLVYSIQLGFMSCTLLYKIEQSDFWRLQAEQHSIDLRYNKKAQSIRVNTEPKELFFLERTGLFKSRVLFKTEYNQLVGELQFTRNYRTGTIRVAEAERQFETDAEGLILMDPQTRLVSRISIPLLPQLENNEFAALVFTYAKIQLGKVRRPATIS